MEIEGVERTRQVMECSTILELLEIIESFGTIPGGDKMIKATDESTLIVRVFSIKDLPFKVLTKTYGIRKKVAELMGIAHQEDQN
jgi:hypothetical protein